jgi:predicted enzyme related to lactoylglutathione lyase
MTPVEHPIVHLELRTPNPPRACAFYAELFGWRAETVRWGRDSYLSFDPGCGIRGGFVEVESEHATWLPYVEVAEISMAIERARALGATVARARREGPAGWRSIVVPPGGEPLALWQPKA